MTSKLSAHIQLEKALHPIVPDDKSGNERMNRIKKRKLYDFIIINSHMLFLPLVI